MKISALTLPLIVAACAPPPATTSTGSPPVPGQVAQIPASSIPRPTPPLVVPSWRPDTNAIAVADRIPPFQTQPLIVWGAEPPGTPHAERVRSYDLVHQVVHVSFDWPRQTTIGTTTLTIAGLPGTAPLPVIAIDAEGMKILSVRSGAAALKYAYDGHSLAVTPTAPLRAGQQTSFTVSYEASTPRKGAYFNQRKHVVWTQGEVEDTRYWVPTYDYPNDKTTWEFFIKSAKGERALSNGRLAGSTPVGADSIEWHWVLDKPASTYLMTAVVGNYTVIQDRPSANGAPIGYWTYPDSVEAAKRGFEHTPNAVDLFSKKTGVPYPWAKYDQIVIPDFQFGGMENVTATSQNDAEILHPAAAMPQAYSGGLMSHELGHQWYGDLLTTRRWDDIWLNEGFATFMEQTFTEADLGFDEGALDRFQAQQQVISADRAARRPIVYGKWERSPFELFFSGHIYPKGATVLQMLRHQLGDDLFWKSMNRYTVDHEFNTVITDDLKVAFEQTTGKNFQSFFDQWVYGAGFPVFQVSSSYDRAAGRVIIEAREIQPRDSLTGFFDVDAGVEIRTDSGVVDMVVPVRNGTGTLGVNVKAAPRSIRWDKGQWILSIVDFPRSTNMLVYELTHDDDVLGRLDAAHLLGQRPDDAIAVAALISAAHNDAFWAVRSEAVRNLGQWNSRPGNRAATAEYAAVKNAVLDASRDVSPHVRQTAAGSLFFYPGLETSARARELAASEPNPFVRGQALASYVRLEKGAALSLVREVLPQDTWANAIRGPVLGALMELNTPEALALIKQYTPPQLDLF